MIDTLSPRRKKMRCDGARPFCGPCSLTRNPGHCEYTDKQGRTFTEVLEERLHLLKVRIKELEERKDDAPVLLHHPYLRREYRSGHEEEYQRLNSPARLSGVSEHGSNVYQLPLSSLETDVNQQFDLSGLVQTFLSQARRLHFVLHASRLLHDLNRHVHDPLRPHESLTSSIALWALRIMGPNAEYDAHESHLLNVSRDSLSAGHSSAVGRHRTQAIQAEILLALYLFNDARVMEGRYHLVAAGTGVLACGLHRISDHLQNPTSPISLSGLGVGEILVLDPPQDAIELGERINLFWSVYALDRCWSVALGSAPVIPDHPISGTAVHSPMPLHLDICNNLSVDEIMSSGELSVRAFFDGSADFSIFEHPSSSVVAFVVAAALFERATRAAADQLAHGMWHIKLDYQVIERLGQSIVKFNRELGERCSESSPAMPQRSSADDGTKHDEHMRVFARSLGYGALIQLYYPFMGNVDAGEHCRSAVREIVRLIRSDLDLSLGHFGVIDFFLGIVWSSSARVVANELAILSSTLSTPGSISPSLISGIPSSSSVATESQQQLVSMLRAQEIAEDLEALLAAVRGLGETCPLIASQLDMLEGSNDE
ncbi:hypothetical protein ACEPAI_8352 [Sanghuangporus weigelae]